MKEEEVSILKDTETTRRKPATISFLCDRDPINTHAAASFVAVDPDECAYFFEVRSQHHACAGVELAHTRQRRTRLPTGRCRASTPP